MAEDDSSQEYPLSKVTEALKSYVKTRQEVLHIRRVSSRYVASHFEDLLSDDLSPISLVTLCSDIKAKEIPSQITGLRKDFLLALQANCKAKRRFAQVAKDIDTLPRQKVQENHQHLESDA